MGPDVVSKAAHTLRQSPGAHLPHLIQGLTGNPQALTNSKCKSSFIDGKKKKKKMVDLTGNSLLAQAAAATKRKGKEKLQTRV